MKLRLAEISHPVRLWHQRPMCPMLLCVNRDQKKRYVVVIMEICLHTVVSFAVVTGP